MLNSHNYQHKTTKIWKSPKLSTPALDQSPDYLRLLAALKEGWRILEAANLLAHGQNAEGRGYLLTLTHPRLMLIREWEVKRSPDIDALLSLEGVPGFSG